MTLTKIAQVTCPRTECESRTFHAYLDSSGRVAWMLCAACGAFAYARGMNVQNQALNGSSPPDKTPVAGTRPGSQRPLAARRQAR